MKRFTIFCPFLLFLTQLALSFAADYDPSFRIGSIPQQQPQDDKLNGGNSMFHQNNPRPFSSNGNFGASSSSSNGNSFQLQNPSSSSSYYHPASADVNQSPAVDLNQFVPPMSGQQQQSRYPNSTAKPNEFLFGQNSQSPSGAEVEVQLRSYSNPGFQVGPSQLCTCPQGNQRCIQSSPQRNGYNCLVGFTVIISSADSPLPFISTSYMPLSPQGQIGLEYQGEFQKQHQFHLNNQPAAIVVLVYNLGAVVNAQTGALEYTNTVTLVDVFTKQLDTGATGGQQSFGSTDQQSQLQGSLTGTQLSLSFSVSCRGQLVGPGCDMRCNSSQINSATAVCQNQKTGYYSLCRWIGGRSQVTDCKNCPWGIKENAYCMDETGGVLEGNHAGVVSTEFRTATIVLGIVCALLLFCLLGSMLLLFSSSVKSRRTRRHAPAQTRNSRESSHFVAGEREIVRPPNTNLPPIISFNNNNNDKPPPYVNTRAVTINTDPPTVVPRSSAGTPVPSAAAAGGHNGSMTNIRLPAPHKSGSSKPSMRPGYQPLPSIANPGAFNPNESFNTSFSHTPSVSADV